MKGTTLAIAFTCVVTLGIHYVWFHRPEVDKAVERRMEKVIPIPVGGATEVKCDAFDVYIVPHDQPSESDADEAGEEYAKDVRCRDVVD